jgi:DNA-binding transcriptional LysR family regulator
LHRVREVFERLDLAREEIAALQHELRGRLVVGTSDTNCTYILPEILRAFRQQHPHVELDIRNRMSSEIMPLVLNNEVDFGIVTLPVRHRDLVSEMLFARSDVFICAPGHELAQRKLVRLEEVGEQPLLALERCSTSRQLLEDDFRRVGVVPEVAMNLGGIDVIKRLVEIGLGVALVPWVAVREEVEADRLVAIRVRGMAPRQIGLVEHRGRRRRPSALAFLEIVKTHIKKVQL